MQSIDDRTSRETIPPKRIQVSNLSRECSHRDATVVIAAMLRGYR
jgi:hypothetical protein